MPFPPGMGMGMGFGLGSGPAAHFPHGAAAELEQEWLDRLMSQVTML